MKILAVEFSSAQRSVAVWESGDAAAPVLLGSAREPPEPRVDKASGAMPPSPFPPRRNLGLVEEALAEAKCRRE
jgi:hypothetical protein